MAHEPPGPQTQTQPIQPFPPLGPLLAGPWRRTLLVLNEYAAHLVSLVGVLAGFKVVEYFVRLTNHNEELIFWKGNPYFEFRAQWGFDTVDLALLMGLLTLGVWLVFRTAVREKS
jgi:hypothetical protein